MVSDPPVGSDGDGVYPHSYERLGAQRGYHISVVVFDPSPAQATGRDVTVQALCGSGVIPATPTPHKTVYLRPGQTKTVTARCPSGQFLVSGSVDQTVRLWQAVRLPGSVAELRHRVCSFVGAGLSRAEWAQYASNIPYRQACPRSTPS